MSYDHIKPNGKYYCWKDDDTLNPLQLAHIAGEINLYANTEAYSEEWYHKGSTYYPIPGTRKLNDLPPIYIQWKDAYRRANVWTDKNERTP